MNQNYSSVSQHPAEEKSHQVTNNQFTQVKSSRNMAWADAMAKILKINKSKRRKTIVLSKAKSQTTMKMLINTKTSHCTRDDKADVLNKTFVSSFDIVNKRNIKGLLKQDWASNGHVKPSLLDQGREKILLKTATKGVVQLLNAVKEHQIGLNEHLKTAGVSENKKEKVLKSLDKREFLNVLMGSAKSQSIGMKTAKDEVIKDTDLPIWTTLREDFMMSSKLKDWDKQVDSEMNCIT